MSTRITCPGCGRLLVLPPDCTAELLSCPRCLTRIDNPQAAGSIYAVQAEVPPVVPTALTPSPASRERRLRIDELDVDVRRDNQRTGCLMILLPVIGGAGIAISLLNVIDDLQYGEFPLLLLLLGVLTVLTLISAGWEAGHRQRAFSGRTVLRVLTISGFIISVGALLCVASLIYLFIVCLSHPPTFH
jgi:hypothetical protein